MEQLFDNNYVNVILNDSDSKNTKAKSKSFPLKIRLVELNTTWGCGLMVGVLILHPERSGSSDSPSLARVVHVAYVAKTRHENLELGLAKAV
ncbi:hypothetical protein CFP56_018770 [Quercus suber]|uniref:Uncharacterized protein n=1 Tax=Quercus suber TaxID=58331 RepID=A0AAW0KKX8_QUESU